MEKMLTDLCEELNNFFWTEKHNGTFTIEDGHVSNVGEFLQEGQYFRIVGSIFNDGVYKYVSDKSDTSLTDEVFEGTIWSMAIPPIVIDLASEISAWKTKYESADSPMMSPYQSESFQNYSYTKGSKTSDGVDPNSWQAVFASKLNRYRRLRNM